MQTSTAWMHCDDGSVLSIQHLYNKQVNKKLSYRRQNADIDSLDALSRRLCPVSSPFIQQAGKQET